MSMNAMRDDVISSLLFCSCPSAVARSVVIIIVNTIK